MVLAFSCQLRASLPSTSQLRSQLTDETLIDTPDFDVVGKWMMEHEEDVDLQQCGKSGNDAGIRNAAADKPSRRPDAGDDEAIREPRVASEPMETAHNDQDAEQEPEHEHEQDDEAIPYPEPEDEETDLLPPPDFRPFFTLIEDSNGDHHHPTVHYIFADDDPEILTNAALETLSPRPQQDKDIPDQRYVVIDMAADGKEVVSASSLSPDWQALTTRISPAPSWGGDSEKKGADRGTMLTVYGHEARKETASRKGKKKMGGSVEDMLKAFDAGLGPLDGVLGTETTTVETHITQHE